MVITKNRLCSLQPRKKKKYINPFATVFESKGIPLPRTYSSIPLSDLKAESPEDKNLRRSTRACIKPLAFWRGECVVWGPNDFGDEFDGVKNMPVPKFIQIADPRGYKARKAPTSSDTKTNKKSKSRKDDVKVAANQEEKLDTKKTRAKYHYNDDGVGNICDDTKGECTDTSKSHLFCSCSYFAFIILIAHIICAVQ
jgi:hypothetical protein